MRGSQFSAARWLAAVAVWGMAATLALGSAPLAIAAAVGGTASDPVEWSQLPHVDITALSVTYDDQAGTVRAEITTRGPVLTGPFWSQLIDYIELGHANLDVPDDIILSLKSTRYGDGRVESSWTTAIGGTRQDGVAEVSYRCNTTIISASSPSLAHLPIDTVTTAIRTQATNQSGLYWFDYLRPDLPLA